MPILQDDQRAGKASLPICDMQPGSACGLHHDVVALTKPVIDIAKQQRLLIGDIRSLEEQTSKSNEDAVRLDRLKDQYEGLRSGVVGPLNTLLGYLLDNFTGALTDAEFNTALRVQGPVITDVETLSGLPKKLIPVIVVRQLSRDFKLAFPFNKVPYFSDYTARYSRHAITTNPIG